MSVLGRPYQPVAAAEDVSAEARATVRRLVREHDWAEPTYFADGTAEVAVLDFRGIIERIVTVSADGSRIGSDPA